MPFDSAELLWIAAASVGIAAASLTSGRGNSQAPNLIFFCIFVHQNQNFGQLLMPGDISHSGYLDRFLFGSQCCWFHLFY